MFIAMFAVALTSCNKDDNGGNDLDDEEINFFLVIDQENMGTKADAGLVGNGSTVDFSKGAIIFTDGAGAVLRYERITDIFGTGTVDPEELKTGKLFAGISPTAEFVHVVGNVDFDGINSMVNISELNTAPFILNLNNQSDNDYGVKNASLYGVGRIVPVGTSSPALTNPAPAAANREAKVILKPLIARFEIQKVSAAAASVSDGFKLEGIYIDDYYYKSSVIGDYSDFQNLVYDEGVSYKYYSRFETAPFTGQDPLVRGYDASIYPILFDDGGEDTPTTTKGLGVAGTNNPSLAIQPQKGAWAYNFYPDATYKPHIILHLTDLEVWDNGTSAFIPYPNTKTGKAGEGYLTVTGYKVPSNASVGAGGSLNLEGGYIYRITDLAFTAGDIREEPEQPDPDPDNDKLDVWVEVELMKWTVVPTEVEFN